MLTHHERMTEDGNVINSVVLYGSYARRTQDGESDIDLAIFVKHKPPREVTNRMIDCVARYELEIGKVLSTIEVESERYHQWKNYLPFYRNIEKEGIVLWKNV